MLTRRKFVLTSFAAGAAAATGSSSTCAQAPSKRTIVDAQAHLWKASSPDYPWAQNAKPQLPEPFTYERALTLMDAAGIDRVVIVPPGLNDVNTYALEAAAKHPARFGVMGRIPIETPKSAELLPKWKEQKGMLGLRVTFNSRPHIKLLEEDGVDWLWPAAEKAGLPIMFLAFGRVARFGPIAERHPGLPLIIDHMGVNQAIAKEGKTAVHIAAAAALAKYPNVGVKLSNLPNASVEPYPFNDLTDHIKRLFDAFGPRRCYWGTDVTNNMAKADWKQRLTHFTEELKFMSEADKDWVLGKSIMSRLGWG
jgi:predicted TIM-barrel fold metal-dependent hydrolase